MAGDDIDDDGDEGSRRMAFPRRRTLPRAPDRLEHDIATGLALSKGPRPYEYRRHGLRKREGDPSRRTERTRRLKAFILDQAAANDGVAPYAFARADGSVASLDTGILGFLANATPPEIDFVLDAEGWIIGVTPLGDEAVVVPARPAPARPAPPYRRLTSRRAVLAAMAEHDRLGAEGFRVRYGFAAAETYTVAHAGRTYDSKALVGVAFGIQFPELGPLASGSFSGGRGHAAGHLHRLGFDVAGMARDPAHWTLAEAEAIVARYFAMFADQAAGAYRRGPHLEAARVALPDRNDSAISRKLSNISAILHAMDLPILDGFGHLPNSQALLTAVVVDWLEGQPAVFDTPPLAPIPVLGLALETPPPTGTVLAEVGSQRRASKVDFAARDARNRALGKAGEAWALEALKAELQAAGRADLAAKVDWVSDRLGDGLGYDIASFDLDGRPLRVEVKATNGGLAAPFVLSANELAASRDDPGSFVLMRVYALSSEPRYYRLRGDLEEVCHLRPATFTAIPA